MGSPTLTAMPESSPGAAPTPPLISPAVRDVLTDLLDELNTIRPDLGHEPTQAAVQGALLAAQDVLGRWR